MLNEVLQDDTPLGTMIDKLSDLRVQKAGLTSQMNQLNEEIEDLEYRIRDTMNAIGIDKASGKDINVTPKTEDYPTFEDSEEFLDWASSTGNLHMLQKRLSAPAVREYLSLHDGELPPGLKTFEKFTLSVTKRRS
jgi:hypothetical protein